MIVLKPGGLWLKLFMLLNKRGWKKPFDAETVTQIMGISKRHAYNLLEILEKTGLVETWYDIKNNKTTKYYRMRVGKITFTDGYVTYEYTPGLIELLDVTINETDRHARGEEEDNPESAYLDSSQDFDSGNRQEA